MQRALGGFERAALLTAEAAACNVVFVLRLTGGISPRRLTRAIAFLQQRHPMLGARIITGRGRPLLTRELSAPALDIRERADGGTWRFVAERELSRPIDLRTEPALRCTLLRQTGKSQEGNEPCDIVLTAHHTVLDGVSSLPLLGELVTLCDPTAADPQPSAKSEVTALPAAAEALFPPAFKGSLRLGGQLAFLLRQVVDELAFRRAHRGQPPMTIAARATCRVVTFHLHRRATSGLVRRCRRERATLNGALLATLLLTSLRTESGRRSDLRRAELLRFFTFVDLRPHLVPPVSDQIVAAYLAPLRLVTSVRDGEAFWPLARRLSLLIGSAGRRGDKFHSVRLMPAIIRWVLRRRERMADVALSYSGPVRLAPAPGGLTLRRLHAFVSNIAQGPRLTATVRLVDGELDWDMVVLREDLDNRQAARIAGRIVCRLAAEGETDHEGDPGGDPRAGGEDAGSGPGLGR